MRMLQLMKINFAKTDLGRKGIYINITMERLLATAISFLSLSQKVTHRFI